MSSRLRCVLNTNPIDGDADCLVSEDKDLLSLKPRYARPAITRCEEALPILDGTTVNLSLRCRATQ